MATWAKHTDAVQDRGFGSSRNGGTIEGAMVHHVAGPDGLGYVANDNDRDSHPTYHVSNSGRCTGIVHPNLAPSSINSRYSSVDRVSVSFEIDNKTIGGDWAISDKAFDKVALIIADHARAGGFKKIVRNTPGKDQPGVFFVGFHSQYQSTACPGPYLTDRIDQLISRAQAYLGGAPVPKPEPSKPAPAPKWAFNTPNGSMQKRIQKALAARGRYGGPVDGVWGINSIKGIQTTIRNVGYNGPIDGIPGERTCHFVQVYAQRFGSYTGPIDSILGPNGWAGFALGLERP